MGLEVEYEPTIDFGKATEITMDKGVRMIVEKMLDMDNSIATLEVTVNEGLSNEATVMMDLSIVSINGTLLEEMNDAES